MCLHTAFQGHTGQANVPTSRLSGAHGTSKCGVCRCKNARAGARTFRQGGAKNPGYCTAPYARHARKTRVEQRWYKEPRFRGVLCSTLCRVVQSTPRKGGSLHHPAQGGAKYPSRERGSVHHPDHGVLCATHEPLMGREPCTPRGWAAIKPSWAGCHTPFMCREPRSLHGQGGRHPSWVGSYTPLMGRAP